MMSAMPTYRRDIDGLRALAILPVLAFHAHVPGFSGGFVGVDIFFVISGFLITGIVAREIDDGRFSLVRFYERRARRILPALLVMLAFVLLASSWLYLPDDFNSVPKSTLMALLFMSNIWFFMKTGYFGGPAESMPLLHCWSLAVEEQFYIGFPILLRLCAGRSNRFRVCTVALLAAISFGLAWWKQADTDSFAFYLLPTRAWELMAGSLLALIGIRQIGNTVLRQVLASGGLGLILLSVFTYSRSTVFPGVAALGPVFGSVLLLQFAPGTWVGRILSSAPLVAIGLISYSLYLWHWPLIVFTEYARDTTLHGGAMALIIAVSVAAAWGSWRFIEGPFRSSKRFGQREIFVLSAWGMAAVGSVSLALVPLGGWAQRFSPQVHQLADAVHDISPKRAVCATRQVGGARPECNLGANAAPSVALWGDSHGIEIAWVLGQKLATDGQSLMQRTRASCPPVVGYSAPTDPDCARFNDEVLDRLLRAPAIRKVYVAAFWASPAYRQPDMVSKLDATIAKLQAAGKMVTIIGPVPPQPFEVPRRLAHAAASGTLNEVEGTSLAAYNADTSWFTANYGRWRARGIMIVDPLTHFTQGNRTRLLANNRPLYFDSHHLSLAGAQLLIN